MQKYTISTLLAALGLGSLFFTVSSAFAQLKAEDAMAGITSIDRVLVAFTGGVVKSTGTLFMALAMVAFLFGIVQYVWALREGVEKDLKTGKQFMLWSLIALFVMFSVYGIVKMAQGILFNNKDINTITIPSLNFDQRAGGSSGAQSAPSAPSAPSASSAYQDCLNKGGDPIGCTGGGLPTSAPAQRPATVPVTKPSQPVSEPYTCHADSDCTIPNTNPPEKGMCNSAGNACTRVSSAYKCTPEYDCTIKDTNEQGICNAAGNACMSVKKK